MRQQARGALASDWPVLATYRGEALRCIAMPMGGIGTGTVSLGGRGQEQRASRGFD